MSRRVADQNGGACLDVEPDNGDPYEFASPQPCLLAAAGEIALDTRPLRDGAHTLELLVEDAAGNLSEVHEGTFETHNAPVLVGAPGIGGQARVGAALTATNGQWDGAPTGYDHRWLRCDADGAQCAPIAGASGAQYVATEADAYRRLVVEVVAENGSGAATARSTPSAPVADAAGRTTPPTVRQPADREPEGDGDDPPRPTPDADAPPRAPPVDTGGVGGLQNPIADQSGRSPNGTNASAAAKLVLSLRFPGGNGGSRRMTASAKQRMRLVGRLTDEQGRPIAGARLNLAVRVMGRRWAARGVVRTDRDGYARHRFAATSSRSIRLTYFPFASSRSFRASNAVVLDVRAPLTISLDRRRVSGKRVVTLRGRAAGGSIPAGGLLITLQGHQRGWGWRTFRTLRTARDGSWRTSYRFRSTSGRFGFRAVVPRQGRYPFLTTTSRPVFVSIR